MIFPSLVLPLANLPIEIPGLESVLQWDGMGGPGGIAFLLMNRTLPSRINIEHLDVDRVHEDLKTGWLSTMTTFCMDANTGRDDSMEQLFLHCPDFSVVFQLTHSSAHGGTYHLKILFNVKQYALVQGWITNEISRLIKSEKAENKGRFFVLSKDAYNGFDCKRAEIDSKKVDLQLMYTDEVNELAPSIIADLTEQQSGLYIFHGPPGTGKTSFINYLIQVVPKDFIFIPANLVDALLLPEFIELLWSYRNSVLIIEDAEKALQKRSRAEYSPVSALLNITDGLLGDVLHLQVICTINSELSVIDPALLRKGRLKGSCFFGKLSVEKADSLASFLSLDCMAVDEVSLGDVFNFGKVVNYRKENKIGF